MLRRHHLPLVVLAALLSAPSVAQAQSECTERSTSDDLVRELDQGELAYSELRAEDFLKEIDEAAFVSRCLAEPLTPQLAARLHWMHGLQLYSRNDEQRAAFSLAAARSLEQSWRISSAVLPAGHDVWKLYLNQQPQPRLEPVAPPREGELYFDGRPGLERPVDRATIVQLVSPAGVSFTRYLLPGDGLPDYGAVVGSPNLGPGPTTRPVRTRLANPWLLSAAGASAIAAGTFYLLARGSESDFETYDPSYSRTDIEGFQAQANRRGAISTGFGVAAVGLGASAFFVGVW